MVPINFNIREVEFETTAIKRFHGFEGVFVNNSGPKIFTASSTTAEIWDFFMKAVILLIAANSDGLSYEDVSLFMAGILVTGLCPQPTYNHYFMDDPLGIYGNSWMKEHFTSNGWSEIHNKIHLSKIYVQIFQSLRKQFQQAWSLHQIVVVDEMIIPFEGHWIHIQFVRGKPHNTGE
jgi:hypothetical protein